MSKVRNGIVAVVVIVLSLYFMAGIFGALPYQYDYIKQNSNPSNAPEQTNESVYGNMTIYHSPVIKGNINSPLTITVRVKESTSNNYVVWLRYVYYYWTEIQGHLYRTPKVLDINMTNNLVSGDTRDGTYRVEIPAINTDVNNNTELQYFVMVIEGSPPDIVTDGYQSQIYTVSMTTDYSSSIFGIDYRVFYVIALALTLIIGYAAWDKGTEKPSKWTKSGND